MVISGIPNESAAQSTEELMTRVQQGDMHAYQELIQVYQKKVYRVVNAYHHNPEDAMEVLQDTFLKVYTSRQTWECKRSFSAWLYRIAINASIDRYRRGGKAKTSSIEDMVETQLQESATVRPSRSPLDKLRDLDRRRVLERAIRRLPARQREVLTLKYFGEMQLEEIAIVLDCPLGTVKSNLHKAVQTLKGMLLGQKEELAYE
jgi:RNA polymerase sigma-70 factor (ECF subfamily)